MDKKDTSILYELDKNSRQPLNLLAKTVKLKRETTQYRLKRLTEKNIITHFFTTYDMPSLGLTIQKILIKTQNCTQTKKKEILTYLNEHPHIIWIVSTDGNYDLAFALLIQNLETVQSFLSEFYELFGSHIQKRSLSVNMNGEYLVRTYLTNDKRDINTPLDYQTKNEHKKTDQTDLNIISQLCENSRKTALHIAKTLDVSSDSVIRRIRRMQQEKILSRYNIMLNNESLGQTHFKVFFQLSDLSKESIAKFRTATKSIPRCFYIIQTLGEWDFEIDLEVENTQQYREIMSLLSSQLSQIIQDYFSLIVYDVHYFNFLPKKILPHLVKK